jgi:phosphatidylserine/phosphatidylglycerophosphate/cardiolipin synthase-like enzyme
MLEGPVAVSLGEMCRERWRASGGEIKAPLRRSGGHWPAGIKPDFDNVPVGIARTTPEMPDQDPVHEIEALYVDLIARAQRWIYAESQYFASRKVAEAIAKRLEEEDGPEIVIVHPTTAEGWLEPIAMDSARAPSGSSEGARRLQTAEALPPLHGWRTADLCSCQGDSSRRRNFASGIVEFQ